MHDWKIVDWDVNHQHKQNQMSDPGPQGPVLKLLPYVHFYDLISSSELNCPQPFDTDLKF